MINCWLYHHNQDLTHSALTSIWEEARKEEVEFLDLSGNQFSEIAFPDFDLPSIKVLDMSRNKAAISQLAFKASQFPQLEYLYLTGSQIAKFSIEGSMPKLKTILIDDNQLTEFSVPVWDFPEMLKVRLKNNPLSNDIIRGFTEEEENSLELLKAHHVKEQKYGTGIDNEYKVLLVGNGNVGKSCFATRLIENRIVKEWDSTNGISVKQYNDASREKCKDDSYLYTLNIWDFGGQDMYHATHRLFMETKSVYLLLWDTENTEQNPTQRMEAGEIRTYKNKGLPYWLDYIKTLGKGSPVLVIQTKSDIHGKQDAPHQQELRDNYSGIIQDFLHIENLAEERTDTGYERLLLEIKTSIRKVQSPKKELLTNCLALRQALRAQLAEGVKKITWEEYIKIAADFDLPDDDSPLSAQNTLTNWLVKTGVVFYKQDLFQNFIILDQEWAIQAIYAIFDRDAEYHNLRAGKKCRNCQDNIPCSRKPACTPGQFFGADLHSIWTDKRFNDGKGFSLEEQELFVSFMLTADLCFEVTPKQENRWNIPFEDRAFVAPQLLPENKDYNIYGYWEDRESYHISYRQPFLHQGIIQSFIVKAHSFVSSVSNDIWQKGIMLQEGKASALAEMVSEQELQVRITKNGKELADKIRNTLEELLDRKVDEWVSHNGQDWVSMEKLKKYPLQNSSIQATNGAYIELSKLNFFLNRSTTEKIEKQESEELNQLISDLCMPEKYHETIPMFDTIIGGDIEYEQFKSNIKHGSTSGLLPQGWQLNALAYHIKSHDAIKTYFGLPIHKKPINPTDMSEPDKNGSININITNTNTNNNSNQLDFEKLENAIPDLIQELVLLREDFNTLAKTVSDEEKIQAGIDLLDSLMKEAEAAEEIAEAKDEKKMKKNSLFKRVGRFGGWLYGEGKTLVSPATIKGIGKSMKVIDEIAKAADIDTGLNFPIE
jgi:small GTP-binding protein